MSDTLGHFILSRCCGSAIFSAQGQLEEVVERASGERSKLPICSTVEPRLLWIVPFLDNYELDRFERVGATSAAPVTSAFLFVPFPCRFMKTSSRLWRNGFSSFLATWNRSPTAAVLLRQGQTSARAALNVRSWSVFRSISFYFLKAFKAAAESLCLAKLFFQGLAFFLFC